MRRSQASEVLDRDRRRLLGTAVGIVIAGATSLIPLDLAPAAEDAAIRPSRIRILEEQLVDLRRRIAATSWPDREKWSPVTSPEGDRS